MRTALQTIYKAVESGDWTLGKAILDIKENKGEIIETAYKALDKTYTYYTGKTKGFVQYPRQELVQHFRKNNLAIKVISIHFIYIPKPNVNKLSVKQYKEPPI